MKIEKEKYSIYILIFGWLYFFTIDYFNYIDFLEQFNDGITEFFPRKGKYDTIWFKFIAIGLGIISFYVSYKSKPINQRKMRILLSLLLIILSIYSFPNLIFRYFI